MSHLCWIQSSSNFQTNRVYLPPPHPSSYKKLSRSPHIKLNSTEQNIMANTPFKHETSKHEKFIDSILLKHEQTQKSRDRYTKTARDAKRKIAASKGVTIPKWEAYWKELDEWKKFAADRDIEKELHPLGLAPPPLELPPRPARPDDLEDVYAPPAGR
ncbi:hypothetical protein DL95DRAFT_96293 [Leptodontidium sp. 2 PMI_412]|nr:hypothetical protein DL95DRAFT_96293 [Leptodontidium sp. 2 PMI_412]